MAEFSVSVPDKVLSDYAQNRIKELEKKLTRMKNSKDERIRQLKKELDDQKHLIKGAEELQVFMKEWNLIYGDRYDPY